MSGDSTRLRAAVIVGSVIGALVSVVAVKTLDRRSTARNLAVAAKPCVSPAETQRRRSLTPAVVTVTEHQAPTFGLRFDPPPPAAYPRFTAGQAYLIATSKFFSDPGPSPQVSLGLLTDDGGMMSTNPDGTVTKMVDNRLTWLVVESETVVRSSGGPSQPPGRPRRLEPRCPLGRQFLPVDAMTGELEFIMAVGGRAG
jgi:hypothetical protein